MPLDLGATNPALGATESEGEQDSRRRREEEGRKRWRETTWAEGIIYLVPKIQTLNRVGVDMGG